MQDRTNDLIEMIRIIAQKPPCQPEWQEEAERRTIQAAHRLEAIIRDIARADKDLLVGVPFTSMTSKIRPSAPQGSDRHKF